MPRDLPQPTDEDIRALIRPLLAAEGPLLPILHALQAEYGCIPGNAVAVIADALNLTGAEVHGVISFYHDFRDAPAGRHVIRICRAEACQAMGADALAARMLQMLGLDWHGTSADGAVTVEPVYCLGLCACGPAVMVDDRLVGRVDADRARALIDEVRA